MWIYDMPVHPSARPHFHAHVHPLRGLYIRTRTSTHASVVSCAPARPAAPRVRGEDAAAAVAVRLGASTWRGGRGGGRRAAAREAGAPRRADRGAARARFCWKPSSLGKVQR